MRGFLLAAAGLLLAGGIAEAAPKIVAITSIVEHPALDAVRDGIKKGLADAGLKEGEDVSYLFETAQGNPATAAQIARQFVGENPAVIVAISTPSAQAVAAATKDVPLVFSAVTDPVGAQLVASVERPGGNVTGVSDMLPVADHVALIREIAPEAKRIGVLYNPGEANSVSSVAALRKAADGEGMTVVEAPATKSADVQSATRSLVGKVDAIYVPTDNTIVSALESAIGVANAAKLPLFAADTDSVARGALAAVGFNYFDVGVQTAAVVERVLKGENPGEIPVTFASGTDLQVNKKTADAIGLTLPPEVLQRASKVVE
ncbi:ABC transporter substrate-binding protein [Propylenella binzhouense]|uniref:ABC transporter substrate-binding protein n=1 Tax=Propylenella binzhouense TaxID=2555902 RepID=UPI003CCCAFE3